MHCHFRLLTYTPTTNNPDQGSLGLLFCESGDKFWGMVDFKHPKCPWKTGMFSLNLLEFGCWKWVGAEGVEFVILLKQFANLIWLLCFRKKLLFDRPASIKGRICRVPEHYESLGCLKILSHFNLHDYFCVCFLYLSD